GDVERLCQEPARLRFLLGRRRRQGDHECQSEGEGPGAAEVEDEHSKSFRANSSASSSHESSLLANGRGRKILPGQVADRCSRQRISYGNRCPWRLPPAKNGEENQHPSDRSHELVSNLKHIQPAF